jgi:catechol 2,3-dioxygenase-like lactoylglutathione lyase family enzyme
MNPSITGLHHVTAIASDPQRTLDFYVGLLGLRFVKHAVALSRDIVGSYFFRAMAPLVPETQPNLSSLRVWIGGGKNSIRLSPHPKRDNWLNCCATREQMSRPISRRRPRIDAP